MKTNPFLFTKNENALLKQRCKYFNFLVKFFNENKEMPKSVQNKKNLFYKSNKVILSNGKRYLSKFDFLKKREYKGKNLEIVDDPVFWVDSDHLRIYELDRQGKS